MVMLASASACTKYVEANGTGDCSSGNACNLDYAKQNALPGDIICMMPGDYGDVVFGEPGDSYGTATDYITYQSHPEPYEAKFSSISFNGPDDFYITISGLDVSSTGTTGIGMYSARNINILDCKVYGPPGGAGPTYGIHMIENSQNILVEDCEVYYSHYGIDAWNSYNITARRNHVHDITGSAFETGNTPAQTGSVYNYIFEYNLIHDLRLDWAPSTHASAFELHSHNTVVRGNTIYNFGNSFQIGFYHSWAGPDGFHDMLVENNLVYKTTDDASDTKHSIFQDVGDNVIIRNNTFVGGHTYALTWIIFAENADGSGLSFHNNVVTGNLMLDNYGAVAPGPGRTESKWNNVNEGNNIVNGYVATGCGYVCIYDSFSDASNSIIRKNGLPLDYFTNDFFRDYDTYDFNPLMTSDACNGNVVPQPGYVGALECVSLTECVDITTLLEYIQQWKEGNIEINALLEKIAAWKTGCS